MPISCTPASTWPAKFAYLSASIFIAASGSVNLLYGIQKGSDPASSAVWGAVSVAASITFALSWPALIRTAGNRSFSGAMVAIVALLLSGGYSISAALGSAGAGRMDAAAQEQDTTGTRKRAQAAYDTAKGEIEGLKASRPVGEIEALVAAAKPVCRIVQNLAGRSEVCSKPPVLLGELGRAQRRAELASSMATASGQLATTPTGRVANADAKVLARYLAALGADIGPDRLNDLLVLLTVALVEMGGGLSLALGLALSAAPAGRPEASPSTPADHSGQSVQPPVHALPSTPATAPVHPTARPATVLDWVAEQGGRAVTSRRKLADALGRPATTVADELARLVAAGAVRATPGPRGTMIELAAAGRPN